MGLKIVVAPTAELLSIEECREHLEVQPYTIDTDGIGWHPHDAMIMRMQGQARRYCENYTSVSLAQRTYELLLDEFPAAEIDLPMPPSAEILSVVYADSSQVEQTIPTTDYVLDNALSESGNAKSAWLLPATGVPWPTAGEFINSVIVRYIAGYLATQPDTDAIGEPLPHDFYSAIVIRMAFLYANREGSPEKSDIANHEECMKAILTPLRTRMICL